MISYEDITPRKYFQEQHPKYRKFIVDSLSPLVKRPMSKPKQNWKELLKPHFQRHGKQYKGGMGDAKISADETCIRVKDEWNYTWFGIGARSKAIWSWHISNDRSVLPALITLAFWPLRLCLILSYYF